MEELKKPEREPSEEYLRRGIEFLTQGNLNERLVELHKMEERGVLARRILDTVKDARKERGVADDEEFIANMFPEGNTWDALVVGEALSKLEE